MSQTFRDQRNHDAINSHLLLGIFLSCCLTIALPQTSLADPVDEDFFETRIRPVLVAHCQECHGAKKQESGLRLDSRQGWLSGGDSGAAIVPGDPDKSLLIQAVRHSDANLEMPPEQPLTPPQIADLETWIAGGAPDPRQPPANGTASERMDVETAAHFWSFQPVRSPPLPTLPDSAAETHPIDAFIGRQLAEHGLTAAPPADKRTLIRRATFDLTGLPPTPEQIAEFLADDSPDAFSALVDRLLNSPAYGQRWGRHWLDVARYADTAGDGADYPVREAGKYRDWVVDAFNADMPFDQFVREQIAGDILAEQGPPERYASQVTATGFLAIGKRYGYKPSPAFQHLDFADAIDSVGRSLMGLSIGCARCHDHKFDPVSAADYYALYGILQSTQWAFPGGEEQKRPSSFPPLVPPDEAARLEQERAGELTRLDAELAGLKRQQAQLDFSWHAGGVDLALEKQATGKPPGKPWFAAGPNQILADAQSPFTHVHPSGTRGVRLGSGNPGDGLRYVFDHSLPHQADQSIHFTVDFRTLAEEPNEPGNTDGTGKADGTGKTDGARGGYRFFLSRGVAASIAVQCSVTPTEFAIRHGSEWEVIRKLHPGQWYTLQLNLDPQAGRYSGFVGTLDDLTPFEDKLLNPNWDGTIDTFICDGHGHTAGPVPVRDVDNIGLQTEKFASPSSEPVQPAAANPGDLEKLAAVQQSIQTLTAQRQTLAATPPYEVAYGVSEGTPVDVPIQLRGEPTRPGEVVPRRFLEVLGGDPVPTETAGSGRLDLAKWLTRRSNPLTARVFVNRVWQWHFGQGLVSTPSDFGARGAPPSHPELLDWLAADFMDSGWSIKRLHRRMMTSQTYQMASDDHPAHLAIDPLNRWRWRYDRQPLDAESIRDALLAISGNLDATVPAQHPFPPVNTWGFTIHRPFHAVYPSNHRSLYLMVQRNRRHPFLALFDAADPNQSVAQRQPTTTPTQALFLMNSEFVHEQSQAFAKRLLDASDADAQRVRLAYEATTGRLPDEQQTADALAFVDAYQQQLSGQQPLSGQQAGDSPTSLAAWAAYARVLMASNAFLYVD